MKKKTKEVFIDNSSQKYVVVIDESLNKYDNVVLFPEALAKVNEILKKTGHPKDYLEKK